MLNLNSAPLANWKFSAMKNATRANNGVQTPAIIATPDVISPSGTSRAKIAEYGSATRSRYAWLHDPAGTDCAQPASCPASCELSVNQRIFPIPSKRKKIPIAIRSIARPVACRSIAICPRGQI